MITVTRVYCLAPTVAKETASARSLLRLSQSFPNVPQRAVIDVSHDPPLESDAQDGRQTEMGMEEGIQVVCRGDFDQGEQSGSRGKVITSMTEHQ